MKLKIDDAESKDDAFSTLEMSNLPRTPPQNRTDGSRSLDQNRDYDEDGEVSVTIERLNRDNSREGLQIYPTNINIDSDDVRHKDPAEASRRLIMDRILLRLESTIKSLALRVSRLEQSRLEDIVQFTHLLQQFREATPIAAIGHRSVMISTSMEPIGSRAGDPNSPMEIEIRRVPLAKYIKLTQISVDIAKKCSVSLGDKTFENLNELKKALRASCLLTLAEGSRLQPVSTVNNVGGYTPQSILVMSNYEGMPRNIIVEEDDCFKYHSDNLAALTLITSMVKPDMHHLIIKAVKNEEATGVFLIIMDYFRGQKHHHIEFARNALSHWKLTQHIDKDISNLRQLIRNLEEAQEALLPEAQKFGILRGMMVDEQRINVIQAFNFACMNNFSFEKVLETLMIMWDNIPYKSLKMATATANIEAKVCFRFQQGKCTSRHCIYVHKLMTEQQKKDSGYHNNNKDSKGKDKKSEKSKSRIA